MALTTEASGTQSASVSTEHTLATDTDAKTFVLMVNLTNMINGDVVVLRLKTKVLTGDTAECVYLACYRDDQGECPIVASPPVTSAFSISATLQQTAGTAGRDFPWSLLSVG
jgi:hypothetical protein